MNIADTSKVSSDLQKNSLCGNYLDSSHLSEILKLQETIVKDLEKNGTPRFVVPRSKEYFEKHLSCPHVIFGLFAPEKDFLAAQMIFRISDKSIEDELCPSGLPEYKKGQVLSVAQGMLVHPDFRGMRLMGILIKQWISWCEENGVDHLASRTEASHDASRNGFIKNGFYVADTIIDPLDNAKVNILHMLPGGKKS